MPSIEILMSRKAKEVSEISHVYWRARWKKIDGGYKVSELLSGRGGSADAVVNVTAVEFRLEAAILTQKFIFDKPTKRLA